MPYRGGGYGRNYQPAFRPDGGEDPLAAAIRSAMEGFLMVRALKQESADRQRQTQVEDADRSFRREQFEYGKSQDEAGRQERMGVRMRDEGVMPTPGGPTPFVMGPGKMERDETLKAGVRDKLDRPELLATAEALGLPNTSALSTAQLRATIAQKSSALEREAAITDYERKEKIDSKYRAPPDPSLAASRDALVQQRTAAEARKKHDDKSSFADKYIEAAGGDFMKAGDLMSRNEPQVMTGLGMVTADLQAAAQRYKDRRNPPARPSASGSIRDEVMASALGEEPAAGAAPVSRRPASDDDITQAVRAVGQDEQKVRAWLIARGIDPDA